MKSLDEIAAQLEGYDPQALSAAQVNQFLQALASPVRTTETLELPQALGRTLAHDVISPVDVPPHDNSAMDGYAFHGTCLQDTQVVRLKVVGTAMAGAAWRGSVAFDECVRIMTGAIMPAGLDTVVPQELTHKDGETIAFDAARLQAGDNRRHRGEDLHAGRPALRGGTRIGPAALGLLASLGVAEVTVMRRLRVAFFSTGDEILSLGDAPREGAVYDSNRYTLLGLLNRLGVDMLDLGVVRDDPQALHQAFTTAAAQADAIITSGGVSVGEADHTKAVMRAIAGPESMAFWRIAMRPGRPMAVGRMGNAVVFGLPGNPVAVMVTFLAFVRPALLQMMGCAAIPQPLLRARSAEAIRKKPGRTEYQRGIVRYDADGQLQVCTTGQQGSGVLRSMVEANGLIVLPHDSANVNVGDWVDVMMFDGVI